MAGIKIITVRQGSTRVAQGFGGGIMAPRYNPSPVPSTPSNQSDNQQSAIGTPSNNDIISQQEAAEKEMFDHLVKQDDHLGSPDAAFDFDGNAGNGPATSGTEARRLSPHHTNPEETTLEEQLESVRHDNLNGFIPESMKQRNDMTTVRGTDQYNAAQTAGNILDSNMALSSVLREMGRYAAMADAEGDYNTADNIDDAIIRVAFNFGKMFSKPAGWAKNLGQSVSNGVSSTGQALKTMSPMNAALPSKVREKMPSWLSDYIDGTPKNWNTPQKNVSLYNMDSTGNAVKDGASIRKFPDIQTQQSKLGKYPLVKQTLNGDKNDLYRVRGTAVGQAGPAFNNLDEQIKFDRNLNRGLGVAGGAAAIGTGFAATNVAQNISMQQEFDKAKDDFHAIVAPQLQAGRLIDPDLTKAYSDYTTALLHNPGNIATARANFEAQIQKNQGLSTTSTNSYTTPRGAQTVFLRNIRFALKKTSGRAKGKLEFQGLNLYIEYPTGSYREKVGKDGKKWRRKMEADYGRISGTKGADGDCLDVFVGLHNDSDKVYIVDQIKENGKFDEHKCIVGCNSAKEARELYLSNYPKNWKIGNLTLKTMTEFKKWLEKSDKSKPAFKA